MTDQTYVFTTTRFQCGCVYRTASDTAVFCPQHRGLIAETTSINTSTPAVPETPGLVMLPTLNIPVTLRNNSHNSLHTTISTYDGQGHEWEEPHDESVGLCAACFIDHEDQRETLIAMCECGDDKCSYRWCGDTSGIHAYWRLHALSKSEEATGVAEDDIFSYGRLPEQSQDVGLALDQERVNFNQEVEALMQEMNDVRQQHATPETAVPNQFIFFVPWLDREYQTLQDSDERLRNRARLTLTRKLARVHIIRALQATTD